MGFMAILMFDTTNGQKLLALSLVSGFSAYAQKQTSEKELL